MGSRHKPIYLDYNATTPVDPEVLEAMLPYLHMTVVVTVLSSFLKRIMHPGKF